MLQVGRVNAVVRATHIVVQDNDGVKFLIPRARVTDWYEWRGVALSGFNPCGWTVPEYANMCIVFSGKSKYRRLGKDRKAP